MTRDEGVAFGKNRADTYSIQIDEILKIVDRTIDVPGVIIEAGSYKCGVSICMAAANPLKSVFAFDLFGTESGLPYGEGVGYETFAQVDLDEVTQATAQFPNLTLVVGKHEDKIPAWAETPTPISLIYLDSDHYSSHKVVLDTLWPLLNCGGALIFHDFGFTAVQQAVKECLDPKNYIQQVSMGMGFLRKIN